MVEKGEMDGYLHFLPFLYFFPFNFSLPDLGSPMKLSQFGKGHPKS